MLFSVFTRTTTEARQKRKHGNENLQRASWYLHQIKKGIYKCSIYVPNQLVKILRTVSPYLALQHVKVSMSSTCIFRHVQLLDPPTQMSKN